MLPLREEVFGTLSGRRPIATIRRMGEPKKPKPAATEEHSAMWKRAVELVKQLTALNQVEPQLQA